MSARERMKALLEKAAYDYDPHGDRPYEDDKILGAMADAVLAARMAAPPEMLREALKQWELRCSDAIDLTGPEWDDLIATVTALNAEPVDPSPTPDARENRQ